MQPKLVGAASETSGDVACNTLLANTCQLTGLALAGSDGLAMTDPTAEGRASSATGKKDLSVNQLNLF